MTLLVEWAVQPLSVALLLWWISLLTLAWTSRRRGRRGGGAPRRVARVALLANALAGALLWAMATPLVANTLLRTLEATRTGPPGCESAPTAGIVVPGAGMDAWTPDTDPWRVLGPDTLSRTLAAAALAERLPDATLYTLGGGDNGRALAPLMREVLLARGVDGARVRTESTSRSTRDNARELVGLLDPATTTDATPIRLVTSALHLRRAAGSFERAGFAVCGTGVASLVSPSVGLPALMPWTTSLRRTSHAVREWVATAAYARH